MNMGRPSARAIFGDETSNYLKHPTVPLARRFLNFFGCLLVCYAAYGVLYYTRWPLTLDFIFSVFQTEYCRWSNERRTKVFNLETKKNDPSHLEHGSSRQAGLDCIASVVCYREDVPLFRRVLKSYVNAESCRFFLLSVDGDDGEDQEMIEEFKTVMSEQSATIHFDIPLVERALKMSESGMPDDQIIIKLCSFVRSKFEENNIRLTGENETLGVPYLWTSDSDTMISQDTLKRTVLSIASDPSFGGTSTALYVHNRDESFVAKFGSAIYLAELYLVRSFSGSVMANECQSGPCAAFRIDALRPEILTWYKQRVFGHWMVVNEDRHLTTLLLSRGWKIGYAADVLVGTESPNTFRRWIVQQVRWGRAENLETYYRPNIYILQHPFLLYSALRRQITFLVTPITFFYFFATGYKLLLPLSTSDFMVRKFWGFIYVVLRNPHRANVAEWLFSIPANLFHNIESPAIGFWSLLTVTDDGWGTTMRSQTQLQLSRKTTIRQKAWQLGFLVVWMGIMSGCVTRETAEILGIDFQKNFWYSLIGATPVWMLGAWLVVIAD